jgi:hypothetical protein
MSNILKGLNEGYFSRDEQDQQNAMDTRRSSDLSRERNAGLNEPDELPTSSVETRNGVYEYSVPTGQEKIAQELGLQLHKGHWFSRVPVQRANFQFGRPQFHEIPSKNVSEAEQDYGPEYQDKVKRLGQMAKQGERKTVWDPVKRVYKTVPVNPPKEQGVAEAELDEEKAKRTEEDIFLKGKKVGSITTTTTKSGMIFYTAQVGNSFVAGLDTREEALKHLKRLYRDSKEQGVAEGSDSSAKTLYKGKDAGGSEVTISYEPDYWPGHSEKYIIRFDGRVKAEMQTLDMAVRALTRDHYDTYRPDLQPNPKTALQQGVAEGFPKDPNAPKLVQDRKTGKWYDPNKEFEKKMTSPEVMAQMKRMAQKEDVAEGVAETLPMDDAVKVLRQYGADHFKTTSNELHFYKQGRPFSVDLVMNPDATRSVTLSSLNSATRGLKGQGVAESVDYKSDAEALKKQGNMIGYHKTMVRYYDALANNASHRADVKRYESLANKHHAASKGVAEEQLDELKCWSGYTRVQGVPAGAPGSCKKKTNEQGVAEVKKNNKNDDHEPFDYDEWKASTVKPRKPRGYKDAEALGKALDSEQSELRNRQQGVTEGLDMEEARERLDSLRRDLKAVTGNYPGDDRNRSILRRQILDLKEKIKASGGKKQGVTEEQEESCPHCGGAMFSEMIMNEKKDACYYKVKSRYKVWPSAYASGALVKCRKSGADSWGDGGKKNESSILEGIEQVDENLNKWFKEKWVRFGPDGKIRGDCARGDDSEGKPKCLPQSKAQNLGKKGRASAASRKRREDPNPERSGKAINVNTKKKD